MSGSPVCADPFTRRSLHSWRPIPRVFAGGSKPGQWKGANQENVLLAGAVPDPQRAPGLPSSFPRLGLLGPMSRDIGMSALDIQGQVHNAHWSPCPQELPRSSGKSFPGKLWEALGSSGSKSFPERRRALDSRTPPAMAPIPVVDGRWTLELADPAQQAVTDARPPGGQMGCGRGDRPPNAAPHPSPAFSWPSPPTAPTVPAAATASWLPLTASCSCPGEFHPMASNCRRMEKSAKEKIWRFSSSQQELATGAAVVGRPEAWWTQGPFRCS